MQRLGLVVITEVSDLSVFLDAANLFFQLVSSSRENVAVILASILPFGMWEEVFGVQPWRGR